MGVDSPKRRIALLSPCGHGNLGDAAIQSAVVHSIAGKLPDVEFVGLTLVPGDTSERHGIESFPLGAISRPAYLIDTTVGSFSNNVDADQNAHTEEDDSDQGRNAIIRGAISVARQLLPKGAPYVIREEWQHIRQAISVVRRIDMLIVSGGGQLDDFWGGPWGHPYAIFKWALLSRLLGKPVIFLSVGYAELSAGLSRWLCRLAWRLGSYRSCRDIGSRAAIEQLGFARGSKVSADLAFNYPGAVAERARTSPRPSLGISPMVYMDPRTWPKKDAEAYRSYIGKLGEVAASLLRSGCKVTMFVSDGPDRAAIDDVLSSQEELGEFSDTGALTVLDVRSVDEFLDSAGQMDVMIVTRLHGAILSFVAGTPVVALAYDRKVTAVMEEMRQARYCLSADEFQPFEVLRVSRDLLEFSQEARSQIRESVEQKRRELDAQYNEVVSACLNSG